MTGTEIFGLVSGAFDLVKSIGQGIIDLIARGRPDETELARLRHQYDLALADLDFKLRQAGIWMQEKLIALEQATGARWRTPLILTSGGAIIVAALNNALAACYLPGAQPVDMTSAPMLVLGGMFLLLVTGDSEMLKSAFRVKPKEGPK
jgi:hypothetical protein